MKASSKLRIDLVKKCCQFYKVKVEDVFMKPEEKGIAVEHALTMICGMLNDEEIGLFKIHDHEIAEYFQLDFKKVVNAVDYNKYKLKNTPAYASIYETILSGVRYNAYLLNENIKTT